MEMHRKNKIDNKFTRRFSIKKTEQNCKERQQKEEHFGQHIGEIVVPKIIHKVNIIVGGCRLISQAQRDKENDTNEDIHSERRNVFGAFSFEVFYGKETGFEEQGEITFKNFGVKSEIIRQEMQQKSFHTVIRLELLTTIGAI